MRLERVRISGFRSVGPEPVSMSFEPFTCVIGPNGSGKTAFLHALAKMFGTERAVRTVLPSDFHIPHDEEPTPGRERTLWIEADFRFNELEADEPSKHAIAAWFNHMRLLEGDTVPRLRFRLTATLESNGDVRPSLEHVVEVGTDEEPTRSIPVNYHDQKFIQVHYVPARRDPSDHVSFASTALLGRLLRAVDWQEERASLKELSEQISAAVATNPAVQAVSEQVLTHWGSLHTGPHLATSSLAFLGGELEGVLRHVTLQFSPGPDEPVVDFSRLSDGQQSLLYVTLALAAHAVGRAALNDDQPVFDVSELNPAVFTLFAVEEPENSLSPHLLGRVVRALETVSEASDAQAVVATHSPALMRRVQPEQVRYLRLDEQRVSRVKPVRMPDQALDAHKFVREALHAYPELYFSRLVVLGEGDSEEVVLPRCLTAHDLTLDAASVSVVPLGGRHVNHFWRLLSGLEIPYVTLLDLDLGRHQGGWGRVKYAATQLRLYNPSVDITQEDIDAIDATSSIRDDDGTRWRSKLERHAIFYSSPLDLDFSMLRDRPDQYDDGVVAGDDEVTEKVIAAVLGKNGSADEYTDAEQQLFAHYHRIFKLGSKPAHHLAALAAMTNEELRTGMPPELARLCAHVVERLKELPA
ncbi:ATP-dependent nuclease [Cellulomonas oligotrophica]|uniref:Chromosome segregation protein SMC n=1 Tax=Cellulomonas oligotrophica TaxID=931536 RepID=A0ABQ4D681_9CELL|nr:AAA family ATPase [Cellulomonas oligotrophica]GIG31237.1 chromosome segregation protein SMC [Cellulomonas oligotrophica]